MYDPLLQLVLDVDALYRHRKYMTHPDMLCFARARSDQNGVLQPYMLSPHFLVDLVVVNYLPPYKPFPTDETSQPIR